MTIKIGTRADKLALWQANHIVHLLRPSGMKTDLVVFESTNEAHVQSTSDLESGLFSGSIHISVLNAQHLPVELPDELELIAFTERESVNDVLLSTNNHLNLQKSGLRVTSSSLRRIAFLKHFYPNVEVVATRANVDTRIENMKAGECDAVMLSHATAIRLGYEPLIAEKIETSYFVPSVGQATIAVACHKKLDFKIKDAIQRLVNHPDTEDCIRTERSFLKSLPGGITIPSFGYAYYEGNLITLKAGIISMDGKRVAKVKDSAPAIEAKELGKRVAMDVLAEGGQEILDKIKKGL
jgi:hydroxymethylbilane synthase